MTPARRAIPAFLVLGMTICLAIAAGPRAAGQQERRQDPNRPQAKRLTPSEQIETDVVTREAVCRWAARPPVLDGKLDDRCWQDAVAITQFASYWDNKTPRPGTRAYLVWDDEALYYGATMTDAELRSYGKHRNDTLWDGDVFEMFFKPSATGPEYYEFQANPRELVFECALPQEWGLPQGLQPGADPGQQGRRPTRRHARPPRRPRHELDRRGAHPLDGVPAHRRQAEAGRRVAIRHLPLRLRPRGHQADPHELRPADQAQLPSPRGLWQAPLRRSPRQEG